ncbi:hypothetical protein IW261DRAFT_1585808 [Armillaria novae-zelandiae]|uniref:6-phosphogluconolactonase n=1 Tax=Armillaria novae-zelandiae TaxID=153914 RepID=A0AA39NWJ1_9AGAR|nr:hypothetical protein IW261DRAFT_1585808 [Armillaria novae-zelandiae]
MATVHHSPNPPTVYSFPSVDKLVSSFAEFIIKAQRESIDKKGRFTIALSGGSLPNVLKGLIGNPGVKWDKWQVFYADERVVPLDDPDSNHLASPSLPTTSILLILPFSTTSRNFPDAYEKELIKEFAKGDSARFPVFDLILLGMGPDGHTVSLFPGHELLAEDDRWVAYLEDSPKPPSKRITFTYPVINHAARVAIYAAGEGKVDILSSVMDKPEEGLPASRVKPVYPGHLYWFVDDLAAAKLEYPKTAFKL